MLTNLAVATSLLTEDMLDSEELDYRKFINGVVSKRQNFSFVSLFSGAGISDFGIALLGGECIAACELDPSRRLVHELNSPAKMFGNIQCEKESLIQFVRSQTQEVDLVIATPPCQSFSSANSKRGKNQDGQSAFKDARNFLFFDALDVCCALKPKYILIENVPNFGRRLLSNQNGTYGHVEEFIDNILEDYIGITLVKCVSEFGVPQSRKRSFSIYIRKDIAKERGVTINTLRSLKFEKPKNHPKNIMQAISQLPKLDSVSEMKAKDINDPFHHVPVLDNRHYSWVANIPTLSGKSAWLNACEHCGEGNTPMFQIQCENCGENILVRPHVVEKNGKIRSIKGFKSSYKRINPLGLSSAITTNTNAFSSDNKLHPSQNRVLSVRECILIQSIPKTFKWSDEVLHRSMHLVREMVGEALPPLASYQLINKILSI